MALSPSSVSVCLFSVCHLKTSSVCVFLYLQLSAFFSLGSTVPMLSQKNGYSSAHSAASDCITLHWKMGFSIAADCGPTEGLTSFLL